MSELLDIAWFLCYNFWYIIHANYQKNHLSFMMKSKIKMQWQKESL